MDDVELVGLFDFVCVIIIVDVIDEVDVVIVVQLINVVIFVCFNEVCFNYGFNILDVCDNDVDVEVVFVIVIDFFIDVEVVIDDYYLEEEDGYFEVIVCIIDDIGFYEVGG